MLCASKGRIQGRILVTENRIKTAKRPCPCVGSKAVTQTTKLEKNMPDGQTITGPSQLLAYAFNQAREMAFKACQAYPFGQHAEFNSVFWTVMNGYGFFPYRPLGWIY